MSERKDGLVSYHLIGRHPNGDVFIQPLNDNVPEELGFWETMALLKLCTDSGSEPIGLIRCRQEGDKVQPHHSYFQNHESPSPEHEEVMVGAILRVMADGTGHLDPSRPYAAEALIEDVKLAQSLGINTKREQR
jgi:hypothetical protein